MKKLYSLLFSSITTYICIIFLGAWITLYYEAQDNNANIKSYYDSLWWTLNTTSIGDSNVYPITPSGRIVGAILIIVGYGLFTVNVATISSFLNHLVSEHKNKSKDFIKNLSAKELENIQHFLKK